MYLIWKKSFYISTFEWIHGFE